MTTISTNTIVSLINTTNNSGTIVLPRTSDIPYRTVLFKDLYGTFNSKSLTLNTQSPDVFEDGTSSKTFNDSYTYLTLYADTADSKWVVLNGTQINSMTVSTLNNVQTANISSVVLNALTFGNGNGFIDATAFRAILMSTIELDASIGNFSSISGDGSQIYNINAISSLSLQSTISGLGSFEYISTFNISSGSAYFGDLEASTIEVLRTLSTNNLFAGTISTPQFNASSINVNRTIVNQINVDRLLGSVASGGANIFTANLFPNGAGSLLGFFGGGGTASGGFYSQVNARSTNTTTITPDIVGVHSNIIRIQGFTSTQQILTSSIFAQANMSTQNVITSNVFVSRIEPYNASRVVANYLHQQGVANSAIGIPTAFYNEGYFNNISNLALVTSSIRVSTIQSRDFVSTNIITTNLLRGSGPFGNLVYATTLLPDGTQNLGNAPVNTWNSAWINTAFVNTIQSNTNLALNINSAVRVLGTLSTQNQLVSSLNANAIYTIGTTTNNVVSTNFLRATTINTDTINNANAAHVSLTNVIPIQSSNINIGFQALSNFFFNTFTFSTTTDVIQGQSINGITNINSAVRVLGTLSSQNMNVSTFNSFNLSSQIINTNTINTNFITSLVSSITIQDTIVPSFDNTFDLGASTNTWRHLYVGGGSIYIGSNNNFGVLSYNNSTSNIGINRNLNINQCNVSNVNLLYTNTSFFGIPSTSNFTEVRSWNSGTVSYSNTGFSDFKAIASDWSFYNAENTINANSYEITNALQTRNLNSAATNVMVRRVYFDNPSNFTIDNTTFSNVLNITTITYPIYNNPNAFYTYLNCTFSFRGFDVKDDVAYYFELSNRTTPSILSGEIFNATYPYVENQKATFYDSNHSITVQEQFNISTWANGDQFLPLMYAKTNTGTHTFRNMKFTMVYEPLLE